MQQRLSSNSLTLTYLFGRSCDLKQVLHSARFHAALLRQLLFTRLVLAIEIPLGLAIALAMPRRGPGYRSAYEGIGVCAGWGYPAGGGVTFLPSFFSPGSIIAEPGVRAFLGLHFCNGDSAANRCGSRNNHSAWGNIRI
jgi:hypothetical protein